MKTLYDFLGALADDDAESLRAAFRKAAKAAHPDLNAGDPDAPLRFRQVVRAHAILSDPEQRAAYDWLLAKADAETGLPSGGNFIYQTIHKLASGVIAMAILAVVAAGAYTLFGHISKASIIPGEVIAAVVPRLHEVAAAAPVARVEAPARNVPAQDVPAEPSEVVAAEHEIITPSQAPTVVDTPPATTNVVTTNVVATTTALMATSAEVTGSLALVPEPAGNDAPSHRERGIAAYRSGDLRVAITEFDLAIKLNPGDADVYVDRGIALYRSREYARAFADMAQAKRIQSTRRTRHQASASSARN